MFAIIFNQCLTHKFIIFEIIIISNCNDNKDDDYANTNDNVSNNYNNDSNNDDNNNNGKGKKYISNDIKDNKSNNDNEDDDDSNNEYTISEINYANILKCFLTVTFNFHFNTLNEL